MDAEFEELIHTAKGMLSASEASDVREFVEARQYTLALEALCGILVDESRHVTPEVYSRIQNLVQHIDGVDPMLTDQVRAQVDRR